MADKVKVVLKDKDGKIKRSLVFPEKNALKLINYRSGWTLPDDSPVELKDGKFVNKPSSKPEKGQTTK